MHFMLSEDQTMLQETLRRVIADHCTGPALVEMIDGKDVQLKALWSQLCALGVGGIVVSEAEGGAGLEMIDLAIAAEVLGYGGAPVPFLGHSLATLALRLAGSAGQKATWLPKLASGEVTGNVAFAEPDADATDRWLHEQWRLDGTRTLTGAKTHVPAGSDQELLVVGLAGGGLGLVLPGTDGIARTRVRGIDRTRRLERIEFAETPFERLPDAEGVAARLEDAALVLLAADAFGGACRCLDMAVQYSQERQQFGRQIAMFQGLRHQLADLAVEIEPARGLYWYAAHAFDHEPAEARRSAALAKAHLADRFLHVARGAVEAHGGIGFTWEYPLHIWLKRAMFDYAWAGGPELHRERIAQMSDWGG